MRETSWVASREWPPRSKKLSSGLAASRPRMSAKMAHRICSRTVAGARPWAGAGLGAGRAARSSLPLGSAAACGPAARPAANARRARRSYRRGPPGSRPRISANMAHRICLADGGGRRGRAAGAGPGAGRAARSSLPLGVSGSAPSTVMVAGSMCSGRCAAACWRTAAASWPSPSGRLRRARRRCGRCCPRGWWRGRCRRPAVCPRGRHRGRSPRPAATPGQAARTASISPGSIRNPRIFTWSSARPANTSCPSAAHRARSPVRYIRAPAGPNGHAANRCAVRPGRPGVAPRQPRPGHIQLPGHPHRHRAQPLIQHKHPGVGDRRPNRQRASRTGRHRAGRGASRWPRSARNR